MGPATEAAIANHRLCLQKLLVGWKAATRDFQVPEEREATAQMVIPWTAQVHRYGHAFLELEKRGLEHEAHPLVRSALEYAVVGHWAAQVGNNAVIARYGVDQRKLRALVDDLRGTRNDMVPTQWKAETFAEYIDDVPLLAVDEEKVIENFSTICHDLGVHNNLYPAYRVLCWITHPTTHGALVYLAGEHRIALEPTTTKPLGHVGLMAHAVFWSRRTVDDLTVDHPYRDWLDELAQSIEVLPRLPVPRSVRDETLKSHE